MLAAHPVNPILPARDGARAESFYREALGLEQLSPPGADPMAFRAGQSTTIVLTELPDRVPPDYPVVSFTVTGIERVVDELTARGVEFMDATASSFQGVEGAIDGAIIDYGPVKSAWLRDTEGNILALNEISASFEAAR